MKNLSIYLIAIIASGTMACAAMAQGTREQLTITRLDCGTIQVNELNLFSDVHAYAGKSMALTNGCYLIRHGEDYLLWDAGLPSSFKSKPLDVNQSISATLNETLLEQLKKLGVDAAKIKYVGISHYHFDHTGQLPDFNHSTLLIGKGDWESISGKTPPEHTDPKQFSDWLSGNSRVELIMGDKDLFGDGSVVMLSTPGHTPGHHGLLVRLVESGPILLTGDATHFAENYANNGVPIFNVNRADTLASLDRIKTLAKNLGATVIIQHETTDIGKLPTFPIAAH